MKRTTLTDWAWFLGTLFVVVVLPPLLAALLSGWRV